HAAWLALDRDCRASQPDAASELRRELLDIAPAAPSDGAPARTIEMEQAMIVEKGDEILRGKTEDLLRRRRPDRGPHRRQIIPEQARCECVLAEIIPERQSGEATGPQVCHALPVEAQYLREHAQIGGREEMAALREQSARGLVGAAAPTAPLEAAGVGRHRKAHAGLDGVDVQMAEQRRQFRIIRLVEHDESDIDVDLLAVIIDLHRVTVAARAQLALVDGDGVAL